MPEQPEEELMCHLERLDQWQELDQHHLDLELICQQVEQLEEQEHIVLDQQVEEELRWHQHHQQVEEEELICQQVEEL